MALARPLAIALFLVIASGCGDSAPPPQPVEPNTYRIYSSFPSSGPAAGASREIISAIDLAIGQSSGQGSARRVEHIKLHLPDQEFRPGVRDAEALNAELAARDPSAVAYIGPYTSGDAAKSLPITNRAGLLQIGVSQTWPGLTQPGWESGEPGMYTPSGQRVYVRLSRSDSVQAQAAARWMLSDGVARAVAASDGSSYSNGMRDSFILAMQAAGRPVIGTLLLAEARLSEASAEVTRLKADAMFYAPSSTRQAIVLAREIQKAGLSKGIYSTDTALNDQFAEGAQQAASSWHIVFNGSPTLPAEGTAQDFSHAFANTYGDEPGIYAAYAYDAANLVIRAVNSLPAPNRSTVASAVLDTNMYRGASGIVSFDKSGDIVGWTMPGYQFRSGSFLNVHTLTSAP